MLMRNNIAFISFRFSVCMSYFQLLFVLYNVGSLVHDLFGVKILNRFSSSSSGSMDYISTNSSLSPSSVSSSSSVFGGLH